MNLEEIVYQANLNESVSKVSHEGIQIVVINLHEMPDFPKEGNKMHSLPFSPESTQERKIHGISYRFYLDRAVELPDGE